ncbi:MFS monocarboxylate transporter protein [Dipodascopsis uninucleata]
MTDIMNVDIGEKDLQKTAKDMQLQTDDCGPKNGDQLVDRSEDFAEDQDYEKNTGLEIPNGGLVAWMQVLGSFFLTMNSWGISSTFGVFETYYTDIHLSNKSPSDFAWIGSLQSFLLLLGGIVTGALFDKGYLRELLITGTCLTVLGLMMLSLATEYWQVLLAQGVCIGLGAGCIFVPSVAIIPSYFSTKRVFATGIANSGSSLGGLIFPIVFHKLQPRIGFAWTTRILGLIVLVTQMYSIIFMRLRVKPLKARILWDKSAFHDSAFLLFVLSTFFTFVGVYIPFYYIQSFAIDKNILTSKTAFYLIAIMNAASCFGRILPNFIADKIGPINIGLPFGFSTMICAFCWLAVRESAGLFVFSVAYGFFSGAFVSLPAPVIVSITRDIEVVGTRIGMGLSFTGIGLLVGTPIAGALLKTPAGYDGAIYFCGAIVAASVVFAVMTRYSIVGWRLLVSV